MNEAAAPSLANLLSSLQKEVTHFGDRIEVAHEIVWRRLAEVEENSSIIESGPKELKEFRTATEEIKVALFNCNSNFRVSELCSKFHSFWGSSVGVSKACRCNFYIYWHKQTTENKIAIETELVEKGFSAFRFWRYTDMMIEPLLGEADDGDPLFSEDSPLWAMAGAYLDLLVYRDALLEDEANFEATRAKNRFSLPENVDDFDIRSIFELAQNNGYGGKLRQLRDHLAKWKADERDKGEKWLLSRAELEQFLRYLSKRQKGKSKS